MKTSVKRKFTIILVITIIFSMIIAYWISMDMIYSSLESQSRNHMKSETLEKFQSIKRYKKEMIGKDLKILIKNLNFEKVFENRGKYNTREDILNLQIEFEKKITQILREYDILVEEDEIRIRFFDENGYFLNGGENEEYIINNIFNQNFFENFDYKVRDNDFFAAIYVNLNLKKGYGGVSLEYNIQDQLQSNWAVLDKDEKKIIANSFLSELEGFNLSEMKNNKIEINKKVYETVVLPIEGIERETKFKLLAIKDVTRLLKRKQEISVYLFLNFLFLFSLVLVFANSIVDLFISALNELTEKMNSLSKGNFDIEFGSLRNRNDEIGILAKNFEDMVDKLKEKIYNLEIAKARYKKNAEKLEKINENFQKNKDELRQKNKNIDRINGMLSSRIKEITNLYYLIINVSKYLTDDKFYEVVVRGIREGLRVRKVIFLELNGLSLEIKGKMGIRTDEKKIDITEEEKSKIKSIRKFRKLNLKKIKHEKIVQLKEFKTPYILPLFSERNREKKDFYGGIIIDLNHEMNSDLEKSIRSYITTIILALENRNLYFELYNKINKLEKITEDLKESERVKNTFIANVSHELKVPLVPIKGYIEMILNGTLGDITIFQRKGLITSLNNAQRLQDMLENILNYSRIESGKYELYNTRFNLILVLNNAIKHSQDLLLKKQIKINKTIDDYNMVVYGDKSAMLQVFINILSNSIKFSQQEQNIDIILKEKSDKYVIKIKDHGIGMQKEELESIFKSFRQLKEGDSREYGGVGLGLTVTQKILEYYGEKLTITSSPGEGTVVKFEFDKAKDTEEK